MSRRLLRSCIQRACDDDIGFTAPTLDVEKQLLGMIKLQCGNSSVVKIEGMLNDLYVTETTMLDFKNKVIRKPFNMRVTRSTHKRAKKEVIEEDEVQDETVPPSEMLVMLLTQNFWPNLVNFPSSSSVILPSPIGMPV